MASRGQYVGKFVYVERANPTKENSSYYDGEYFCYRQSENVLHCMSFKSGYDFSSYKRAFPLVGEARYNVIDAYEDDKALADGIAMVEDFIVKEATPRRQYIESVGRQAEENLRRLRRAIGKERTASESEKSQLLTMRLAEPLEKGSYELVVMDGVVTCAKRVIPI